MIDLLNLKEQQFAKDYRAWSKYYNYMQICFYVTRISKQSARFQRFDSDIKFPNSINFNSLTTDKFVLTKKSNRATMGRNFTDTMFVQDNYYNIARYIFNHPHETHDDEYSSMIEHLKEYQICIPKAVAMQYIIGAIETSDLEIFKMCLDNLDKVPWDAAMANVNGKLISRWNADNNPNWKSSNELHYPFKGFGLRLQ